MFEKLFSPIKINGLEILNRTVHEPMGNAYSNETGEATQREADFYTERAKGGCGLIITETVITHPDMLGCGNSKQMAIGRDDLIAGHKALTDQVHAAGGRIFIEIYHSGRQGVAKPGQTLPAPSEVECQLVHQPVHAMTIDEIKEIEGYFVAAGKRAKEAGYDGVEVHGAHGYLIGEFLSPYTNRRTDEYGGSTENRCRFLREIFEGIRAEVGPDYPLIVRYSADEYLRFNGIEEGITIDEGVAIAKQIEAMGADAVDVSAGIYETMNQAWEPVGYDQGWKISNAKAVKEAVSIPVIACSVIRDPEYAEYVLEQGFCDMVGSARQFLADAHWPQKAKEGRPEEVRKCISCLNCMEFLMREEPVTCAVNPEAGMEGVYTNFDKVGNGRVVAIVGAGCAGMEAAHILAKRGFKPVIFESKTELGGQLQYANKPPKKDKMNWLIEYQSRMIAKHGIEVRLNTPATAENLKELKPYKVIWAAGSSPVKPRAIEGLDLDCVVTPPEVLSGKVKFYGKNICVVGSGMTGIETAELLADQGNTVNVYEMVDDIGPGIHFQTLIDVLGRLAPHNVGLFPKHQLLKVEPGSCEFKNTETEEVEKVEFDYLVLSLGVRGNAIPDDIQAAFPDIINVGDSEKAGRIQHATATGYKAAYDLQ